MRLPFHVDVLYGFPRIAFRYREGRGTVDYQTTKMDFPDYLKQGDQTARHRELWRLLRTLKQDSDLDRMIE